MESRNAKVIVSKAGGTAGNGAKTYKLALPSSWIKAMGLTNANAHVALSFDGQSIMVRPVRSMEEYKTERLSKRHDLLEILYYNGDTLCTRIYADETVKDLRAENMTVNLVKTAFGPDPSPSWSDFEEFLEERCIPRQRAGLREYLEALGLDEYDPLSIIRKTKGRMAEDDQWMEVRKIG